MKNYMKKGQPNLEVPTECDEDEDSSFLINEKSGEKLPMSRVTDEHLEKARAIIDARMALFNYAQSKPEEYPQIKFGNSSRMIEDLRKSKDPNKQDSEYDRLIDELENAEQELGFKLII
ncbi:hypothetical protein HOL46_00650 [Candidatus Falkowbacteria bacterium]|jgi:hypothetical protein|nr:hypothetical protein [Candidatus Falkowbacteria bacterium]